MVTGSKVATILASLGAFGVKAIAKEVGKNKQNIDAFSEIKQGVQYRVTIDNLTKDLNILKEKKKELEKEQENKKNSIIKKKAMQESCDESLLNLYFNNIVLM